LARNAGTAGIAVLCLALIAAASAALAAGGPVQEAHAQQDQLILTPIGKLQDGGSRELDGAAGVDVYKENDKTYAVVVGTNDHGLSVIDITTPSNPAHVGRYQDGSSSQLNSPRGVEVHRTSSGTYYASVVGKDDAVQLIRLSDPTDPGWGGVLTDTSGLLLGNSFRAAAFESGGRDYLAVPSPTDDGLQIVDVHASPCPCPAGKLADNDQERLLEGAAGVDIFKRSGRTYAAVASSSDDGLQIVDITDPDSPAAAGGTADSGDPNGRELDGAFDVAVFERGGMTYAAVTANDDDGIAIVDVSNPLRPAQVGRLRDTGELRLGGPTGIDAFRIGAYSYVAVASDEDAIQIVNVTDPRRPADAGKLTENKNLVLTNTNDVKVFKHGYSTYAVVTSFAEDGIQMVSIRHPDDEPPSFVSAELDEKDTRILTITFDEAVDVSETRLSKIYVSGPGDQNTVSLAGAALDGDAGDSAAISLTLTQSQLRQIAQINTPQLDIGPLAVHDLAANPIHHSPNKPISTAPPRFVSAELDTSTRILTVVFDETIDASSVLVHGFIIGDGTDTFTLSGAVVLSTSDSDTVSMRLTRSHIDGFTGLGDAFLNILHKTLSDTSGAEIEYTFGNTLTLADTAPPTLVSATYNQLTGILEITFDETVDTSEVSPLDVVLAAGMSQFSLDDSDFDGNAPDSDAITVTLHDDVQNRIDTEGSLAIDIRNDAVKDLAGNGLSTGGFVPVTLADITPPQPVSASLDLSTKRITVVFDEAIDGGWHNSIDYRGDGGNLVLPLARDSSDHSTLTRVLTDPEFATIDEDGEFLIFGDRFRDLAGNGNLLLRDMPVTFIPLPDTEPPAFVSATFYLDTRVLEIVFDEVIDVSETALGDIIIEDPTPQIDNLTLEDLLEDFDRNAPDSATLTVTLDDRMADTVDPSMELIAGAVKDLAGNGIAFTAGNDIAVVGPGPTPEPPDTTPPSVVSATLDRDTMELNVVFDETIDVSETDLLGIRIYSGSHASIATGAPVFDRDAPDSDTLTVTLDDFFDFIDFGIDTGITLGADSVKDVSGNGIAYTPRAALTDVTPNPPVDPNPPDTTPPRAVSATIDLGTMELNVVFDETIDISLTDLGRITVRSQGQSAPLDSGSEDFDRNAPDSDTLTVTLDLPDSSNFFDFDSLTGLWIQDAAVTDAAGNGILAVANVSLTDVTPGPRPPCAPPSSGHWDIRDSCTLASDARAPAGIVIHAPATLVIPAGVTLDVDLENHGLLIKQGAGLLIESGGRMR